MNVKYRLWERTILPLMLILIGGVNHALVLYSRWIFLQETTAWLPAMLFSMRWGSSESF